MNAADRRKSSVAPSMMGILAAKRMSKMWSGKTGPRASTGSSQAPFIKLENTYRLEPTRKLQACDAKEIVDEIMQEHLEGKQYNPRTAVMLTKLVGESIKERIKSDLIFDRYKLIVYLHIGEQKNQGIHVASRCLWNDQFDTYVTSSYQNSSLFCVVTVFAVTMD